ncbi:S8 family serine peptidase [Paenibacillus chondroitinus]|uniref:S8 family serine peptidase n=1 Tax=Paenibacillus chondroitinus TaxID=59842 RepID=A0ABU6DA59_9BACL|nr:MULTISPECIES: S8 family serine peptidase [Paenibacillus]MCY9661702.1 S8 family serine peptidase [Paenibacillus anseongense]MEB4793787.1 S8 family serine peptidase [Paenibacillus chondroitinus]
MTRKSKNMASALLSSMLLFGVVTPSLAVQPEKNDPIRKSQWSEGQASLDSTISVESHTNSSLQETGQQPSFVNSLPEKQKYAADHVIVKYRSEPNSVYADALSKQVIGASPLAVPNAKLLKLAAGADVPGVIQELLKDPNVVYAEPDYQVSSAVNPQTFRPVNVPSQSAVSAADSGDDSPPLPNDPLFHEQWALNNTGQDLNGGVVPGGTSDIDMDLPEAWQITKGSKDVTVAVIGTGVKLDVPDLVGQIWTNEKEIPDNNIDDDGNGLIDDVNGWDFAHGDNTLFDTIDGLNDVYGTTVAGQIAAKMNNGEGIAGVAPNVKVMPIKVTSEAGGYFTDVVNAIQYAEENGVKIATLGIVYTYRSKLIEDAINASPMLFVAPAGESGGAIMNADVSPVYPAAYPSSNVLSVTGVNIIGTMSLGAARGQASVDVAAPSELIISTSPDVNAGYAAQIDNGVYKAYYNGIGFEEIPIDTPETAGQRQDMFNRAMTYLKPVDGVEPKILLVNDSRRSGGEIGPMYESDPFAVYKGLLENAGYTYETFETPDESFDGPPLEQLKQYNVVVWFSGTAATANNSKLITDVDQDNLTRYLTGGGHLMLTGQDLIDQSLNSKFVLDVLGIKLVKEGGYIFKTWGVPGTIYDNQTYRLMDVSLFYDTVISNKPEMTTINLKNSNGNYSYSQGTLYAAAYAAGVAALVESQNPAMDVLDIKQRVVNSGKTLSDLKANTVSGKLISAYRALWNKDIPGMSLLDSSVNARLDQANDPNHVYSVELNAGEEATFSLAGAAETDFDLILYDSSAKTVQSKEGAVAFSETAGKSSESITYRADKTGTYYINVYAVAGAGNYTLNVRYSNESESIEDEDPTLHYDGNWAALSGPSYSQGTIKQLTGDGYVQFGFKGNMFEWIGTKNDAQGIGEIWIDGIISGYADLYSKTPQSKQSLFKTVLPNGHHDVVIRSSGGGGQKKSINVDAFHLSGLISPTHAAANYIGPWATRYGANYPDGVQTYTTTPVSSAEFTFTGTKVTLWSTTGSNRGKVNIYIDGISVTPVPIDLYSESLRYRVPVFMSGELSNSMHKIKIVHAGEANSKSSNSIVTIDGLDVENLR